MPGALLNLAARGTIYKLGFLQLASIWSMYQRWLAAFHAVARSGGFTAAAKVLNIGQPTVSSHVGKLEDHFGVELFYRRGRRIDLTPIGKMLLTITEGLFGHEGEAIELLRAARAREIGSLKVGAVRPPEAMEITSTLLKRHPNLQIVVTVGSAADILNALLNFELDVGVIAHKPLDPRFFVSFYKRFRLHIVANSDHPLAKRRSIRIEQLEGQRIIQRTTGVTRSVFNRALVKAGVKIRPVLETNSLEGVLAAIIQGIGLGAISDSGLTGVLGHHRLKVFPVINADMFTDAYVVCLEERRQRPLIGSFLHCANEGAHKMSTARNQ